MADRAREEAVGGGTGLAMVAKGKGKKGRGTSESTERKFLGSLQTYLLGESGEMWLARSVVL